jgi:hypothetical protein
VEVDVDTRPPGTSAGSVRGIMAASIVVSIVAGVLIAVSAVHSVVTTIQTGQVASLLAVEQTLPGRANGGSADLVAGHYAIADVLVAGLPSGVIALHLFGTVTNAVMALVLAATLAMISWRLLRSTPFARRLSATVSAAGGLFMVGSLASAGVGVMAAWLTADDLNTPAADGAGLWPMVATVDPTLIALGFGMLVVGLAFEYGEHLHRDTVGLV